MASVKPVAFPPGLPRTLNYEWLFVPDYYYMGVGHEGHPRTSSENRAADEKRERRDE